jgi:hypothetical protein
MSFWIERFEGSKDWIKKFIHNKGRLDFKSGTLCTNSDDNPSIDLFYQEPYDGKRIQLTIEWDLMYDSFDASPKTFYSYADLNNVSQISVWNKEGNELIFRAENPKFQAYRTDSDEEKIWGLMIDFLKNIDNGDKNE